MLFNHAHFSVGKTLHSDASMCMESSNSKFHLILHNNGSGRTHAQCHPKLHILRTKTCLCLNLQKITLCLVNTLKSTKMFQMMSLTDNSLIKSNVRLSVFSEIDVNNGCILPHAGVTLVLAVAYLALVFEETWGPNCSIRQQVHMQDH